MDAMVIQICALTEPGMEQFPIEGIIHGTEDDAAMGEKRDRNAGKTVIVHKVGSSVDGIDDEAEGIFCPQNNEYVNTSDMVNLIAHANGKGMVLLGGFTWALKLLRPLTGIVDKAFGSLCYDFELSRYPTDYCVKDYQESILETEK